jgi:hypothetical protein
MRNSDNVTHIGYTIGGISPKGKLTSKIRFITSEANYKLRTKELTKMGMTEQWFIPLPTPMTKANAINYLQSRNDKELGNPVVRDAIQNAVARLIPTNTNIK